MKRLIIKHAAIAICAVAAFLLTSCIYESAGDKFYRTLWESAEVPENVLGETSNTDGAISETAQVKSSWMKGLTLEFLCGQSISLKSSGSPLLHFGTYESNHFTATFHGLTLKTDGLTITFIDATREGDTLYLRWCATTDDPNIASLTISDLYTITLHRLSAYK